MKLKEVIAAKNLQKKLVITEKKKEVKLAKVEANREEERNKVKLEEMKIDIVNKAKAMKQLLAEEREIMMMTIKDMKEQQMEC
jgi:hypothetical protein